jgi:hypothetical protein
MTSNGCMRRSAPIGKTCPLSSWAHCHTHLGAGNNGSDTSYRGQQPPHSSTMAGGIDDHSSSNR